MAFFGKSLSSRKIDIDTKSLSSDDPDVLKRLHRIESNFDRLDEILSDLEARFELDERLTAEVDQEIDVNKIGKKKPR